MRAKRTLAATAGTLIGLATVAGVHSSSSSEVSARPPSSSSTTPRTGGAVSLDGLNAAVLWHRVAWYAAVPTTTTTTRPPSSSVIRGGCGGALPPCYVMIRESRGSLTAKNPDSTASGKWQFLDSTWHGYGGYAHASDAPEWVQDSRAAEVWAGGRGCSHWDAC